MLEFSTDWVTILGIVLGVVFPILVNIVTTLKTTRPVRGTLLAVLSLIAGVLTQMEAAFTSGVAFNLLNAFVVGLAAFLVAVASAWGLWGPTNVSTYLRANVGVKKDIEK